MKTEPKKISWEKMVMLVSAAMLQGKPRSFSTFVGSMGGGSVWVGDAVVIMALLVNYNPLLVMSVSILQVVL
jgi:threonine/homoserine/homoserine lactone efflux protein